MNMAKNMIRQLSRSIKYVTVSESPESALRYLSALVVKRSNSTEASTQEASNDWANAKPYIEMPGPKPWPLVGNFYMFLPVIGEFKDLDFANLGKYIHDKYGDIVKLTGFGTMFNQVFVFDPADVEKFMRNEGQWPNRPSMRSIKYYRSKLRKEEYGGIGGAIASQDEEWQQFRSKMNPTMMQPRATKIYVGPIDTVANDFIKRIRKLRDEKQEMPENFNNELYKWALESITYIALDTRLGCLDDNLPADSEPQKMIDAVQEIFDGLYNMEARPSLWMFISTPAWRKFVKASDKFGAMASKYIDEASKRLKALPKDSDRELTVLEKLLARDPNPKTAMVMAMDMMMAGVDTTSYSVANVLYFLSKNPDKQAKLFQELVRYLPDKTQPVTSDILNELKYLKACIKESMRLKPITLGSVRKMPKDLVIKNYRIPKGTDVISLNAYMCTLDKFFPQADKYIPERWLKEADGGMPEARMTHPFVYMPFGFGARMCLGRRFAELEMETLISKIVRNFHTEFNYGEMKYKTGLLYFPCSPLKFRFVDRN